MPTKNHNIFDISVHYNVIPYLLKPDININETNEMINISTFSKKINADYITVNLGVSFPI